MLCPWATFPSLIPRVLHKSLWIAGCLAGHFLCLLLKYERRRLFFFTFPFCIHQQEASNLIDFLQTHDYGDSEFLVLKKEKREPCLPGKEVEKEKEERKVLFCNYTGWHFFCDIIDPAYSNKSSSRHLLLFSALVAGFLHTLFTQYFPSLVG